MNDLLVNSLRAGMKCSHLCIPHSSLSKEGTSANVWWIALTPPSLRTDLSTETKSGTSVLPSLTRQAPHLCLHTHCLLRLGHMPPPLVCCFPMRPDHHHPHTPHTHTHTHTYTCSLQTLSLTSFPLPAHTWKSGLCYRGMCILGSCPIWSSEM